MRSKYWHIAGGEKIYFCIGRKSDKVFGTIYINIPLDRVFFINANLLDQQITLILVL
jgi:hypothetical protein